MNHHLFSLPMQYLIIMTFESALKYCSKGLNCS